MKKKKEIKNKSRDYLVEIKLTHRKILQNCFIPKKEIIKLKNHYEKDNPNLEFNIFKIYDKND